MLYQTSDSLTQVPRDAWRSRDTLILVKLYVSPVHRFVRSVSHLLIAALATTVIFSDQIATATRLVCPGFSKMQIIISAMAALMTVLLAKAADSALLAIVIATSECLEENDACR